MKHFIVILFAAVIFFAVNTSCNKTDIAKSSDALAIKPSDALVTTARSFFNSNIVNTRSTFTSSNKGSFRRQQINKIPLWENAYITHSKTKGNVVVVPLQYEKPLNLKTNFGNGDILSMDKQSNLLIYKDALGKYKAEVMIALPNKAYQDGIVKSFAGYILEEDWAGNNIATYLYKNGKMRTLKKPSTPINNNTINNRVGQECYVVDWYLCDNIQGGVGTNCQHLYSEYIGCDGGGGEEGGGGGGGGGGDNGGNPAEDLDYEFNAQATVYWTVHSFGAAGEIKSVEIIKGKKKASEPRGGHFTSIFHQSDACNNSSGVWASTYWDLNHSELVASSRIRGIWSSQGVNTPIENFKSWWFDQVF